MIEADVPAEAASEVPPHVPADLVVDVDFYAIAGREGDIFQAWKSFADHCRRLRGDGAPIVYTPRNGGHWIVVDGHAVEALFADASNLSNRSISIPSHEGLHILPGEGDGEEHRQTRLAAQQWFTPQRVRGLAGPIRGIAAELIDGFAGKGECDFMTDFAFKIPLHLFFALMQLPLADGQMLLDAAEGIIRESEAEKKIAAMAGVFRYLEAVVDMRSKGPGDDLISHLIQSRYDDGPLPRALVLSISVNLLLAGLDTVASMFGFIVRHLAGDPALRQRLADHPEQIRGAIEELARRFPVATLGRVVARDLAYGGVTMREGERVLLPTVLHSLDDRIFDRPMTVDIDRPVAPILSFGRGPHQCLGSLLARVELVSALGEWLARVPEFTLVPGKPPLVSCGHITAMTSLPLRWDPPSQERASSQVD